MKPRTFPIAITAVVLALLPAAGASAQTLVAADPGAGAVTALDGTLVWVSRSESAAGQPVERLVMRDAAGTRPVQGAPPARLYRSIDLGRDRRNQLVLTYVRCETFTRCAVRRDDLQGRRASVRLPGPRGCTPTTAPALWRERIAYGLACRRGGRQDPQRSGVYVRTGSGTPRRLRRPSDAARFGVSEATAVDLRGTQVAAVLADIYSYAVTQTVRGTGLRSFLAGASEGETQSDVRGLALGPGGVLWALTNAESAGDLQTIVYRLAGACRQVQVLASEPGSQRFRAQDIAVDGDLVHLVVPGTGIVAQPFVPERPCP